MTQHRSPRSIPLWQIAPFCLLPPALVAGASLYWDLPPSLFLLTFALAGLTLAGLLATRPAVRWTLVAVAIVLLLLLAVVGGDLSHWTAAAVTWMQSGLGGM